MGTVIPQTGSIVCWAGGVGADEQHLWDSLLMMFSLAS
jgi:hypothetical protein